MESFDQVNGWVLTVILFWPLVSALLVLAFGGSDRTIKTGSIIASLLPLGL
jgi:hypothetical protein